MVLGVTAVLVVTRGSADAVGGGRDSVFEPEM